MQFRIDKKVKVFISQKEGFKVKMIFKFKRGI